jgi:hypothetical protein
MVFEGKSEGARARGVPAGAEAAIISFFQSMEVEMSKKLILAVVGLALSVPLAAQAHHGWAWTTGENIELTGKVTSVKLGNPHGIVNMDVEGVSWRLEVGPPSRNQRAGLKNDDLAEGIVLKVDGEPSRDPAEKRLKVERLWIGDRQYVLYPDRS